MDGAFITGFNTVFGAMFKIAIISLGAGVLVRKGVVSDSDITAMSRLTVNIFLPCMIFASMITRFDPRAITWWWLLPMSAVIMNLFGLTSGRILFGKKYMENREMVAMGALQNSGYLVLPIGQALFPNSFDSFANLCFLFLIGNTPMLWGAGKYLISGSGTISVKEFLTPPTLASVIGVFIVLLGLDGFIPRMLIESSAFIGSATIPVATLILGATLGQVSIKHLPARSNLVKMISVKYFLLPLFTWGCMTLFNVPAKMPLLATLLMLQASAAPATGLILQARTYGGNTRIVSSAMMVAYLLCIFAIPFWISIAAPV